MIPMIHRSQIPATVYGRYSSALRSNTFLHSSLLSLSGPLRDPIFRFRRNPRSEGNRDRPDNRAWQKRRLRMLEAGRSNEAAAAFAERIAADTNSRRRLISDERSKENL